jgi:DnaK suppressor protein
MAVARASIGDLRRTLLERRARLESEVEDGTRQRLDEDRVRNGPGETGDAGDASTANEQAELLNAQIERDTAELRSVDAALARIEDGSYGKCTRCGGEIGDARLRASPSAERCIACQTALEKLFASNATPSL